MKKVSNDSSVGDVRDARGEFLIGARLADALECEAGIDHQIQPTAERAMKARHAEFWVLGLHFARGGAEVPLIDAAVGLIEISADFDTDALTVLVVHVPAVW